MHKSIEELHELLIKKKVSSQELIDEAILKSNEIQKECNAFVTILNDVKAGIVTDSLLSGIPYGVKDNYATEGILTTGSSNTLQNYVPFFNATAIDNLNKSGAVIVNKTALDEFAMGGTGMTAHTGPVKNPWDKSRMCAGSSSGSACAVASGVYPFALGSDTGDSIRKPAAFCGIVGYKPTYGMISRFGVFPFASSLDHCGPLTRNVKDAAIVVDAMKGLDDKDLTSWDSKEIKLADSLDGQVKGKKVCYIKEICDLKNYKNPSPELIEHLNNFYESLDKCRNLGIEVDEVSIDINLLKSIASVYMVISCAEATSNMANLTGLNFGVKGQGKNYLEMFKDHRTKGFSPLIKRRFIIGSYVLQKENQERYYKNAARLRRLLVDEYKKLFTKYDAIILPVGTGPAKYLDLSKNPDDKDTSILDDHLQIGNFGGFPSITIPNGFVTNLPVALNITGNCYDDVNVLNIAYALESTMPYKNQIAKEVQI